jgi:toxin ParE1/3/4
LAKPVRLRELAATDLEESSEYYRQHSGVSTALEFIDAVERAIRRIGRNPNVGSLRFAYELGIPDLRAWPVPKFAHIVFYVDADDVIDVWRILHSRHDLPATLRDPNT